MVLRLGELRSYSLDVDVLPSWIPLNLFDISKVQAHPHRDVLEHFVYAVVAEYSLTQIPECFMDHESLVAEFITLYNAWQAGPDRSLALHCGLGRIKGWYAADYCLAKRTCLTALERQCNHAPQLDELGVASTAVPLDPNSDLRAAVAAGTDLHLYTNVVESYPFFTTTRQGPKSLHKAMQQSPQFLEICHFGELLRHRFYLEKLIPACFFLHAAILDEVTELFTRYAQEATEIPAAISFMERLDRSLSMITSSFDSSHCAQSRVHQNVVPPPYATRAVEQVLARDLFSDECLGGLQ